MRPPTGLKLVFLASLVVGQGIVALAHTDPAPTEKAGATPLSPAEQRKQWKTPGPPYPEAALDTHAQGECLVQASTDHQGNVDKVTLRRSTGNQTLDDSTVAFARANWHGPPESVIRVPIRYVLNRASPIETAGWFMPTPPYPYGARLNNEQGHGVIEVACDDAGNPVKVAMERSTGHGDLDESIVSYARVHWHGPPNGKIKFPVDYRLTGRHGETGMAKRGADGWYTPMPHYPPASVRFMESGAGTVKVSTDTRGRVTAAAMSKSTGYKRLDENSVNYALGFWDGPPNSQREVEVSYVMKLPHY